MIIDLFYMWGEKWVKVYDEGNKCFGVLMIVMALILYAGTGYFTWMNFYWFTGISG